MSPRKPPDANPTLDRVLEGAARRDELSVLKLSRQVTALLEQFGAYSIRRDWSKTTRELVILVADSWGETRRGTTADRHVENTVKNHFWGVVLDLMTEGNVQAGNIFFPTVRRLLTRWDGSRRYEAGWDDVAQDTARQLWERWRNGEVDRPWALLCTIAKRRYLDLVRGTKPTDEIEDEILEEREGEDTGGAIFTAQALSALETEERAIITRMDLQGQTRLEIAEELGMTEGQVLSIRRAGLRRIWRWLGSDLPPALREVWEEMFKGSKRLRPEQVARKLGLPVEEVLDRLGQARQLTGVG